MKICPTCQVSYPNNYAVCPADGTPLLETSIWADGSVIRGKYRIVAKVGQGGMGSVYKATHLAFDELRALKVIAPELISDDLFVKRFKHEAVITRRLQHPNAVRVDDIDEAEDGRPFIVMEFIEGKSLKKLIKEEGPLPYQRVLAIIKQCARALDAAHRLGMVHRDIKPDNIALVDSPEGEMVKVLDFGIAKVKEARMGEAAGMTLTGAGVVIGTPQYMSPEQAMGKRGDELDGRADLYSLGVVMYQMLTADLPFKADTTMEMLLAHMQKPPAPIAALHPELQVPDGVAVLTMSLLEKNRDLRPASGQALVQEIEKIEREEPTFGATRVVRPDSLMSATGAQPVSGGVTPSRPGSAASPVRPEPSRVGSVQVARPQPPYVPPQPKPAESRWGMWAALAVLLVGVAGGGIWIATRQTNPPPNPVGPLSATLTADPTSILKGQSATLRWSSQNANDLDIEPSVGKVQPEGSAAVTPNQSTVYTLTATGPGGSQSPTARVVVTIPTPVEPPPVVERHPEKTAPKVVKNITPPVQPPPPVVPAVDPKEVKAKLTMGRFHRGRGEYDEAIASFQEGLRLDPKNVDLQQELDNTIKACKKVNAILNEGLKCGGN
jgi:serine/threonine-protein kinase